MNTRLDDFGEELDGEKGLVAQHELRLKALCQFSRVKGAKGEDLKTLALRQRRKPQTGWHAMT